jgi:hypothetical protein
LNDKQAAGGTRAVALSESLALSEVEWVEQASPNSRAPSGGIYLTPLNAREINSRKRFYSQVILTPFDPRVL